MKLQHAHRDRRHRVFIGASREPHGSAGPSHRSRRISRVSCPRWSAMLEQRKEGTPVSLPYICSESEEASRFRDARRR